MCCITLVSECHTMVYWATEYRYVFHLSLKYFKMLIKKLFFWVWNVLICLKLQYKTNKEKSVSHYMSSFIFTKETVPHLENASSESWWGLQKPFIKQRVPSSVWNGAEGTSISWNPLKETCCWTTAVNTLLKGFWTKQVNLIPLWWESVRVHKTVTHSHKLLT